MKRSWKALTMGFVTTMLLSGNAMAGGHVIDIAPPIAIAESLLGKSAQEIESMEEQGKTLGQQLIEAGKIDAFKAALKQQAAEDLDAMCARGQIAREKADEVLKELSAQFDRWDGTDVQRTITQGAGIGGNLSTAEELLGMTRQELLAALESQSLGQLLIGAGCLEDYKAIALKELRERVEENVRVGNLKAEQAVRLVATMSPSIAAWDGGVA